MNKLRSLALLAAPLAVAAFAGCTEKAPSGADAAPPPSASSAAATPSTSSSVVAAPRTNARAPVREGGALARAAGEAALWIADEDHRVLRKIPLPVPAEGSPLPAPIELPGAPAQVLALADRVLVTIRGVPDDVSKPSSPTRPPGLLLIMRPDAQKGLVEAARVDLPADAWGIAITPDESTALVTSAWTHKVSAVDLAAAKVRWTIDVPREPRAVVIRPDGASAYVTHLVGAAVTRIDDLAGTPRIHAVELPPAPARAPSGKTLNASLAYSAVLNDDGSRLFVARHALGALGQGSWFGAMTLDVLATRLDTPVLPKRLPGLPAVKNPLLAKLTDAGLVTSLDVAAGELTPVTQPRASAYRKSAKTVVVIGEGDDRLAELDALSAAPAIKPVAIYKIGSKYDPHLQIAGVCGAPAGLALSEDEKLAYVFCRSTYDLATVKLSDPENPPPPPHVQPGQDRSRESPTEVTAIHLADDPMEKEAMLGRRLFHNATDALTSGGLACAGCHPEGRDDGHVWHEAKVASLNESERVIFIAEPELAPNEKDGKIGYARQTPMLAGRIGFDGPYGWHAQNKDLVARLKEGFGLHRWSSVYRKGEGEQLARIQYLRAFVRSGLVNPPKEKRELTDEEKRGQSVFLSETTQCAKCHVPEPEYTDRMAYPLSPKLPPPAGFEEDPKAEFKTPSLRYVGGTSPYFHDGRYSTLETLIDQNNDRMGKTSSLNKDERAALVAFLRTL
jgi:DNA-binding beta-propeller fold protein YncE